MIMSCRQGGETMKRASVYIIVLSLVVPAAAFSGTYYPEIATYPTGNGVDLLREGGCHDFNGDGVCDLAFRVPCTEGDTAIRIVILCGNPDGSFQPATEIEIPSASPCDIGTPVVTDHNGDGLDDIAAAYDYWSGGDCFGIVLGTNDGSSTWTRSCVPVMSVLPGYPVMPIGVDYISGTFDCNGDGLDELVVGSYGTYGDFYAPVMILWNNLASNGTYFVGYMEETLGWGFAPACPGDFNGDGSEDALEHHSYSSFSVLTSDGELGFEFFDSYGGSYGGAAWTGNFNGDAYDDYIYCDDFTFDSSGWYFRIVYGGADSLRAGPEIPTCKSYDEYAGRPLVGDINGDGMDDAGTIGSWVEPGFTSLYIHYSEGEVFGASPDTLMLPVFFGDSSTCYNVLAADLDGDNIDDLLYMCAPGTLAVISSLQPIATTLQALESRYDPGVGTVLAWEATVDDGAVFVVGRTAGPAGPGGPSPVSIGVVPADHNRTGYTFTDSEASGFSGGTVTYLLSVTEDGGGRRFLGEISLEIPALRTGLSQNYPNPFNPATTIEFVIEKAGPVGLEVYDVSGRLVKRLLGRSLKAGRHSVSWDGLNESGNAVSSGVYFYRLRTGKTEFTREMVLLR
jgi:hypothetical protein